MADQWWMGYLVHVVRLGFIYTCNMIAKNHPCALDGCVNRGGDWRQRCGSDICVCVSVCVSGAPHRRRPESPVPAGLIKTAESKTGTTVLQKRAGNPVAIPK